MQSKVRKDVIHVAELETRFLLELRPNLMRFCL